MLGGHMKCWKLNPDQSHASHMQGKHPGSLLSLQLLVKKFLRDSKLQNGDVVTTSRREISGPIGSTC